MVTARDSPDAIDQWIALLDEVERLMRSAPCVRGGLDAVEPAFTALYAHEHTMTSAQRYQARVTLWRRDHPGEPLPALPDRSPLHGDCTCRACRLARRRALADRREAAWHAQLRTLNQQKQRQQRKEH